MTHHLPKNLLPFICYFLRPYKLVAVILVCLATIAGFWGPFNSILIKWLIDILVENQNVDISLLKWPASLIALNFIVFDNITWRSIEYINYKFQATIKNQIISKLLYFTMGNSHQFFQNKLSGRLASQINILADNIERILHKLLPDFIRSISLLIITFVAAYYVNQVFFYILFLWFIIFSLFSITMSKRLVNLADNHAGYESVISGQLVDTITNNSNIRIFAKSDYEISRMKQFFSASKKAFQAKDLFAFYLHIAQGMMIAIMMGFAAYFLVYFYDKGEITIGDFALIRKHSVKVVIDN